VIDPAWALFGGFQVIIFTGGAYYSLKEYKAITFPQHPELGRALICTIYAIAVVGIFRWVIFRVAL
jgi:hypothetical protein